MVTNHTFLFTISNFFEEASSLYQVDVIGTLHKCFLPIGNYEALSNISWQEICKGLVLTNSISATPQANFSLTSSRGQRNNEGLLRKVFKKTKNRSSLIFCTLNYKYMVLKSGRISGLLV